MEDYNDDDDIYDRVDDYGEDENVFGEDEAEEDNGFDDEKTDKKTADEEKPVKVKRVVQRPQPKLNLQTLQGPKGLLALNELFKNFKFRGSGYEEEDYAQILNRLEQWAYRLFPKFHFEDTLKRLENLGKKREIHVYLQKIRSGLVDSFDIVQNFDDDDDPNADVAPEAQPGSSSASDAFDELLSQQIAQSQNTTVTTPSQPQLTDEQKARIERNKRFALEKRLQKQKELEESQLASQMEVE